MRLCSIASGSSGNSVSYTHLDVYKRQTEDILNGAVDLISAKQEAETGDIVIVTAGIPSPNFKQTKAGVSNMMRIAVID